MLHDVDLETSFRGFRLGQADAGELGIGEDRRREHRVVRAPRTVAEHVLHRDARLVLRGRGEHRACRDIACGPDALDIRPLAVVDGDAAARDLDSDPVEGELFDVRRAAGGEDDVRHRDPAAAEQRVDAFAVAREGVDAAVQDDLDPFVLERRLELVRRLGVGTGRELKRAKIWANSSPTGPAPTMSSDSGTSWSSSALTWSIQSTFSIPGIGGTAVRPPVAIRIFSAVS